MEKLIDQIIGYENGELDDDEITSLFQELVDNGLAWELQGSYGRTAARLLRDGRITSPDHNLRYQPAVLGRITNDDR